ncbi:MAG TPA: response regulator [Terriglobales bacterium]|jgi:DNA-binding response OmpR family regulator|nr:response regulator [Terriglobales bacterium]
MTLTKKILLAEDDRFMRRAAEATLRHHGFTVITAPDGEEALRLAQCEVPDLVLLDLIMPKLHGFEVLKALKSDPATSQIPVIVFSNLGQESDSRMAHELGALDYWVKSNLGLEDLAGRLELLLRTDGVQ